MRFRSVDQQTPYKQKFLEIDAQQAAADWVIAENAPVFNRSFTWKIPGRRYKYFKYSDLAMGCVDFFGAFVDWALYGIEPALLIVTASTKTDRQWSYLRRFVNE